MKLLKPVIINLGIALLTFASCCRTGDEVWDDTKTCGRYVGRGFSSLGGKQRDSRAVYCREDFYCEERFAPPCESIAQEFVPLCDNPPVEDLSMAPLSAPQPQETPGDPGSSVPGIDAFRDPASNPKLSGIFRNIHFEYNSNLVKGQKNMDTLHRIAEHMRNNSNVYIFVEGHCDERGPEAYNLALGSRRANTVRNLLVDQGVNPDHIFTISYGKERPLIVGSDEESMAQNRRAEFKIFIR